MDPSLSSQQELLLRRLTVRSATVWSPPFPSVLPPLPKSWRLATLGPGSQEEDASWSPAASRTMRARRNSDPSRATPGQTLLLVDPSQVVQKLQRALKANSSAVVVMDVAGSSPCIGTDGVLLARLRTLESVLLAQAASSDTLDLGRDQDSCALLGWLLDYPVVYQPGVGGKNCLGGELLVLVKLSLGTCDLTSFSFPECLSLQLHEHLVQARARFASLGVQWQEHVVEVSVVAL